MVDVADCTTPAHQLLACLELLHSCGIVHADAKPDNWSLVSRPPQEVADVHCYCCCETCQHLAAIWQHAGFSVALIDFGISKIERFDQGNDFAVPVVYSGATAVSGYQCPAMLAGEPWKYDVSFFVGLPSDKDEVICGTAGCVWP
jgi:serine/threonine protein kinase